MIATAVAVFCIWCTVSPRATIAFSIQQTPGLRMQDVSADLLDGECGRGVLVDDSGNLIVRDVKSGLHNVVVLAQGSNDFLVTEIQVRASESNKSLPVSLHGTRSPKVPFPVVNFDSNESVLDEKAAAYVRSVFHYLKTNTAAHLLIHGHCDDQGDDRTNDKLGMSRALAIKRALVALGISGKRLHAVSYGKRKHVALNDDAYSRMLNRRVEFIAIAPIRIAHQASNDTNGSEDEGNQSRLKFPVAVATENRLRLVSARNS